ncbi:MAG: DUF4153 domain-containing protein [Gemmatimonadaceae bacterium]
MTRLRPDSTLLWLWVASLAMASIGVAILFDGAPGINWGIWTALAGAGLIAFTWRTRGRMGATMLVTILLACAIAFAAGMSANPIAYPLIIMSVGLLLAMAMLLSTDERAERVQISFMAWSPIIAGMRALTEAVRRSSEGAELVLARRSLPAVRGAALAVPVVVVFALLLANADPLFASLRDGVWETITQWVAVPKIVFFIGLLTIVLGAYGFAARGAALGTPTLDAALFPTVRVGDTERLMVIGAVASLFALFLTLQVSYLFGNAPAVVGSGFTFAEYARRGFAELTIVATLCGLMIIVLERYAERGRRDAMIRGIELVVVVELVCLLVSAFRRVTLYEAAYGYTTSRVYAQAYMLVMLVLLALLGLEIRGGISVGRLTRHAALTGALAFVALLYWNHEGWIAERNIWRFESTGKLDELYLTRDLSANALPAVVAALPRLGEERASWIRECLSDKYVGRYMLARDDRWYEWNRGRDGARVALAAIGIDVTGKRMSTQAAHCRVEYRAAG